MSLFSKLTSKDKKKKAKKKLKKEKKKAKKQAQEMARIEAETNRLTNLHKIEGKKRLSFFIISGVVLVIGIGGVIFISTRGK